MQPTKDFDMPNARGAACFMPYVQRAERELRRAKCTEFLSDECFLQLLRGLLCDLVACGRDVVNRELSSRLALHGDLYALDVRLAPKALVDEAEEDFVSQVMQSDGKALDDAAPLLRKVLDRQTERFIGAMTELCNRIARDHIVLEHEFFDSRPFGTITHVDFGDADSHDGGRRTSVVTCDAGKLVYKPHDCRIDEWFHDVAEKHLPDVLRVPRVVVREDAGGAYGYCEFIDRVSVSDERGIDRFWNRMGKACALFYLLGSEDLHGRNFVSCGEHPAVVDLETIMSPEPLTHGDAEKCPNIARTLGGFTADLVQTLVTSGIHARFDSKRGNLSPFFLRSASCLPMWNGREYDVTGFEDQVSAGFTEACARLLSRKSELIRDVNAADALYIRWIVRPTAVYGKLLKLLREAGSYDVDTRAEIPAALKRAFVIEDDDTSTDGACADDVRNNLVDAATADPVAESLLVASEMASVLDGDVPLFRIRAGSTVVHTADGNEIKGLLGSSALDRSLARIRENGQRERDFTLAVLDANLKFAEVEDEAACVEACMPAAEPLDAQTAQAEAEIIFERLENLSVTSPSGCTAWLFRSYDQRTLSEPGNGFANGVWGMAPFFAALARTTHDEGVRERAQAHLEMCMNRMAEVMSCLHDARSIPETSVSLGLASGFGGMLRSATLVHQVSDSAVVKNAAEDLAFEMLRMLSCADIENAALSSVYSGCAGLLLALCQCPWLDERDDAKSAFERIVARLDSMRVLRAADGHVVWRTFERDWAISGFGNGVAGVGAALAAADARGASCGEAARAAFAWERGTYNDTLGTWPDYRESPLGGDYVHGVCSGAPGVGLAAVIANRAMSTCSTYDNELAALTRDLIDLADTACVELPPSRRDTLCCGCGSVVEYWFARDKRNDVGRLLASEVNRNNAIGHYVFQGRHRRQSDDPSLFFGLSGVGYNLLRYANPSMPGLIA